MEGMKEGEGRKVGSGGRKQGRSVKEEMKEGGGTPRKESRRQRKEGRKKGEEAVRTQEGKERRRKKGRKMKEDEGRKEGRKEGSTFSGSRIMRGGLFSPRLALYFF
jgi:hypothetical protein